VSRLAILPAALLIALSLAACGGKSSSKAGGISVVTSLPVFADMVEQVGGDRVDVSSLFPTGARFGRMVRRAHVGCHGARRYG